MQAQIETASTRHKLIDTHTHFDLACFDDDRLALVQAAYQRGVTDLVLIGYVAKHFARLIHVADEINTAQQGLRAWLAPGLHPFYAPEHSVSDLLQVERFIKAHRCVAIGEIGLDTFTPELKVPAIYDFQKQLFIAQIELAQQANLPLMLHIRRTHADALAILKKMKFRGGGIGHAFGGGIEEAKAFIKLGFKLGITGQITDPNAKKLRTVAQHVGVEHLVLETDCPDMTPLPCRQAHTKHTRNTPAYLPAVCEGLAACLALPVAVVAATCYANTLSALPALTHALPLITSPNQI